MHLFIETRDSTFVESAAFPRLLQSLTFKRRDLVIVDVSFLADGQIISAWEGYPTGRIGIKANGNYDGEYWVANSSWTVINATTFRFLCNFNTAALNASFLSNPNAVTLDGMLEIEWIYQGAISSTNTLSVYIANDVIRGDEGSPVAFTSPTGFHLMSPNGTVYGVSITNDGVLATTPTGTFAAPSGLAVVAPNGSAYTLSVDNNGVLVTTLV